MMKRLLTGIKPTGKPTLGNYIGALKRIKEYQDDYDTFLFVANLHALTLPIDAQELRENSRDLAALMIAAGVDPERTTLFLQSDVPELSELTVILQNYTYMGELSRMTQFKDLSQKSKEQNIGTGIFAYPILMTADIILYDADLVPVGEDQKQHVELARDLAMRMNHRYDKSLFVVPEPVLPKTGARIKSLNDPSKKMSKSDPKGNIGLLDDLDEVRKIVNRAVTDSDNKIIFDPQNKPGVSNLLTIYAALNNVEISTAEAHFANQNYGTLKREVGDIIIEHLRLLQTRYHEIIASGELDKILAAGAVKARAVAHTVLDRVQKTIGIK